MEQSEPINIYECFDQSGDPSHYICWGHVDSESFRDKCYTEYSVRPLVIQHKWQRTQKVLFKESEKKRTRGKFHNIQCSESAKNATAITVGIVPKDETGHDTPEIVLN